MSPKTTVAFMQNVWVRDAEHLTELFATHGEEYRLAMIKKLLFMGCVSGKRLQAAFGNHVNDIIWEESTRKIAASPKTVFPPDLDHIKRVLSTYRPRIVLTFGRIATTAVSEVRQSVDAAFFHIASPHPAARGETSVYRLKQAAKDYIGTLNRNL